MSTDPRSRESGFTIIELLISVFIAVEILIGAAIAFDVHNRMTQVQTQITDMQQSLRIAHYDLNRIVRMAGRGDLPANIDPQGPSRVPPQRTGYAIEVRNNVGGTVNADDDRNIARGDADTPLAVEGTDILIVRGCFSNLYQLNPLSDFFSGNGTGTPLLTIPKVSYIGFTQSLTPLVRAADAAGDDPSIGRLALISPENVGVYGIADVTAISFSGGSAEDPDAATLTLDLGIDSALNLLDTGINPARNRFPPNMSASAACLLEELRYYVREEFDVAGDASTLRPRLARARFLPGTETLLDDMDLADGIFDLQVAFGFDSDRPASGTTPGSFQDDVDFIGVDDTIFEGPIGNAARATDDWLYNDPGDQPNDVQWLVHANQGSPSPPVELVYLRVTTLARTVRADPSFSAPDFDTVAGSDLIEDNDYDDAPANFFTTGDQLKFRRRGLTTVIDLRNL